MTIKCERVECGYGVGMYKYKAICKYISIQNYSSFVTELKGKKEIE